MPRHAIKRQPWSPEEENRLREMLALKRYSFNQLAPFFPGRNGNSLRKHALVHMGLSNEGFILHKHSYNQRFFETPNPVNCYVAGYYAADGHIADNPTTRILTMTLSNIEWHQLETFKRLFEYTGPVVDTSYDYAPNMCALRLYGAHQITADLERNFGLTPRKTHRLPAPNLTDPHLQLCYLAGLLDGDGCVHISKYGFIVISYVSASRAIVEWVKGFTNSLNLLSVRKGRKGEILTTSGIAAYTYKIVGAKAIDLIKRIQCLKKEGLPILDRKWDNERLNSYIRDFEARHGITIPIIASSTSVSSCASSALSSSVQPV